MPTEPGVSVVIAAHNEASTIGPCLDALLVEAEPGELDVVVVANGCTDGTAAAADRPGVRVIELPRPGKAAALNTGDTAVTGFPRIYLDADIILPPGAYRLLASALTRAGTDGGRPPLAVAPRRNVDLAGRPLLVRAYYAINSRLPLFEHALFGRGVIALSAAGRARFDVFPDLVADDLFLDSLFTAKEKRQLDDVAPRIAAPMRTADLIRRLARVRSGNAAMRRAATRGEAPTGVRPAARTSWWRDVVLPRPWLLPAAICYVAITLAAAVQARRSPATAQQWGRDESTRQEAAS